MSPEQIGLIIAAVVGLIGIIFASVGFYVRWVLTVQVPRIADEQIKDREHQRAIEDKLTDTELQTKRIEAEVDAQQAIALPEAFIKTTTMLGQVLERHAVVDERNADIAENRNAIDKQRIEADKQQMETLNRLTNGIEAMNRSIQLSQTWHENRANESIDTDNEISLRMGNMERNLASLVKEVFPEVREKLIVIHANTAQQSTLLAIETGLKSVTLMLESLVPKPSDLVKAQPIDEDVLKQLEDTIPLGEDELVATTKKLPPIDLEEIPDHIATPKPVTDESLLKEEKP